MKKTHSSHLAFEGYAVKVENSSWCISNKSNLPMIFLDRRAAEIVEMDFHRYKANQYIATSVVKVKVEEIEDENLDRDRQWCNRDDCCCEGRGLSCFHRDTDQEGTELHEEEGHNFQNRL